MRRKKRFVRLTAAMGWAASLVVFLPFAVVLINSFKNKRESYSMALSLPKAEWRFINYIDVIHEGHLIRSFFNSLLYSTADAVICVLVCAMAAFVMHRNRTRFRRAFYYLAFAGLIAPVNLVVVLQVLRFFSLSGSMLGLILLYVAMGIPFTLFLIYNFVGTIPREIDEAAIIDGAGIFSLFFRVVLPMMSIVVITAGVLTFLGSWNDFITPLYVLNSTSKWGMVLAVYNFWGFYQQQWGKICAVIVLTLIPVLTLYIFCQKYIVSGMAEGAIKG